MSKAKRQERRAKRREKIKKAIKQAKKLAGDVANVAVYAPILPFAVMMRAVLKKKGFRPERKVSKLVEQFYKNVVKHETYEEHLIDDVVSIVKDILQWFKKKKTDKDEGKEQTDTEKAVAEHQDDVEKSAKAEKEGTADSEEKETAGSSGGFMKGNTMIWVLLAVVVVAGLVMYKKS